MRVVQRGMRLTDLSNEEILTSLETLVAEGDRIVAKVITYLVEVEDRRLHLELACSSMFDFCTRKMGFSEGEAFRRLTAARLVRRFPTILEAIAAGRIHLSSVVLLRDLFTEDNVNELIATASGKTKRAVQELVARLAPRPDVASSIRKLPDAPIATPQAAPSETRAPARSMTPAPRQAQLEPLSESRYKVQLTAGAELRDKLDHARALMSHQNPSGDLAVVVERALDLLIAKLEKEKLGKVDRPRQAAAASPSDPGRIRRSARRKVVERDGLQCSFVSDDGARCPARTFLELDHRHPRALGGSGEATNVRVLCRAHNRHADEQVFGRAHVEERIYLRQRKGRPDTETTSPPHAETRERVRSTLRSLGFRSVEAERAVASMAPETWSRPIEALLRGDRRAHGLML